MNHMSKGPARRIRLRAVVAFPAVAVALVISVALVLTPFGPAQGMTPAALPTPTPTPTEAATATTVPPTPDTTTVAPTTIPTTTASTTTAPTTAASATPAPNLTHSPGAAFGDHHVLARIEGSQLQANYLPMDEPVPNAAQFQTFRLRFRLHNAGALPITVAPRLEFRPELGGSFAVVPEQPQLGIPFHLNGEWVPSLGLGGHTMQGALGEDIALADFRIGKAAGLAMVGHRSMGANPDQPVTLPSDSYTEEEFTVTLSIDAKYLTGYELRITNGGTALTGTDVAVIRLGSPPAVKLSPGQHQGLPVPGPKSSSKPTSGAGVAK